MREPREEPDDQHPAAGLRDAWRRPERWADRLAHSRAGLWLIGVASFLETIIVPIPIEVALIPYMLARRDRVWTIALVTTLGCLAGSALGYAVGYLLYDAVARPLIDAMGWAQAFGEFQAWFAADGFWAILAIGIVPIPFQVAMLTAGAAGYPLLLFMLAATIARGIRYFGLALLVVLVGDRALDLWRRRRLTFALALVAVIAILMLLKSTLFSGASLPTA
jgi:membrane protein YqaA with SNARE-associated domain